MRIANFTLKSAWQYGFALLFMLALPFWGAAQTFSGNGLPTPVPAVGTSGTTDVEADVTITGIIGTDFDIDNVTIDITHTFDGDLDITLIAPTGESLELTTDNGGAGDDFTQTVFQDGGMDITAGSAPFTGTFQPEGGTFAAAFAGVQTNGTWTLNIVDDAGGDSGEITQFDITFDGMAPPPPPPPGMVTFCGAGNPQPVPVSGTGTSTCSTATTSAATASTPGGNIIGTDASIESVEIDITHTFDSDLEISLISPNGLTLDLSSDNGGAGDDYAMTVFQDGAPSIVTGAAPFTGTFSPEGGTFAATFAGEPVDGDWTLNVCDDLGGDVGTLNSYCINFLLDEVTGPVNDECAGALPIECDETVSGSTVDATISEEAGFCGDTAHNTSPGVWYTFVSDGSTYTASTCDAADYDTKIGIFTGTCAALECVDGNDDGLGCTGFTSELTFPTVAGETYYIIVSGFGGDTGDFELSLTCCDPPVALCQDIDIIADDSDDITVTADDIDNGSMADCGGLVLTLEATLNDSDDDDDSVTLTCFDDGDNEVTLTATDMFGVTATCTANVNIINTFVPEEIGCIGDLNVTLGDDCTVRITPGMVLTGNNVECAPNATVFIDGEETDIITGCGTFEYVVEVGFPEMLTTEFQAADWTFVEEVGFACAGEFATATLTPDEIDLSILWGDVISASYTAPVDGDVTFSYDFNDADTGFDMFVLDVNGVEIFNVNFAVNGVVNEPLLAGQTIVIELDDDDFCGEPAPGNPARVVLNNFSFVSEAMDFNTCWGTINAEDKTAPEIECPDDVDEGTVTFELQTLEGEIDGTEESLELANYSCFLNFFEAVPGTDYSYDLIEFTVTGSDVYNFLVDSDNGSTVIALFAGTFDEDNPCENVLGGSDGAYAIVDFFGVQFASFFNQNFRVPLQLEAGQTYTLLIANDGTPTDYTLGVVSDEGNEVVTAGISDPQPVDLQVPLYCEDVDAVRFFAPQSWIVDANGELDFNATRNTYFGGSSAALNDFLEQLGITGIPTGTDNCGSSTITLVDVLDESGDCGDITITRTFTITDRADGVCETPTAPALSASCEQVITFTRPSLQSSLFEPNPQLVIPPFTAIIECDEFFETDGSTGGPDENPTVLFTGEPFILTVSGYTPLRNVYCNIGFSYSDEPRIEICEGSYSFRREFNFVNWCDPSENFIYDQYVKIKDFTGPELTGVDETIDVSTSPFDCVANFVVPQPVLVDGDGCSTSTLTTFTILAIDEDDNESFFSTGDFIGPDLQQLPIGVYRLQICAEDACGNETCETYEVNVEDTIEPTAACNDELNVSIGGGDVANDVFGIARIFAEDVDEGSNDNCGDVTLEVRRNFWRNNDCDPSPNRFSPWGPFVDFYCCDIGNEITIELRVIDENNNRNVCWIVVTPEDKLNPFCIAPDDVELDCDDLPLTFPGSIEDAYDTDFAGTSLMMDALFGGASGTDNCAVDTIVERTPNIQVNECGWGTITRRFEAWQLRPEGDVNNNGAIDIGEVFRSTNSCTQLIVINEVHDFEIDFPEDAEADCGDPDVPTVITTATGCDVLSVNIGEPQRFEASGDECYKLSITYDVINWCVWDGEYEGLVLPRITEDDGEALPVDRAVEGNERPVVRVFSTMGSTDDNCDGDDTDAGEADDDNVRYFLTIDRRHNDRNGDSSIPDVDYDNTSTNGDNCIPADQFGRRNYGRYIYTQFVKVYDSTAPVVTVGDFGGPTANCPDLAPGQFGDDDGNCVEAVSIPFSVADDCELFDGDGNLVVEVVSAELDAFAVDANNDGDIKSNEFVAEPGSAGDVLANITDNGDGTYSFDGTYPIISNAMGDNVFHAIRVLFRDGCGNLTSTIIVFDVIDCKGPAPICINGLTVTLMPQEPGTDADGDGDEDSCAMAIWANDFEGSPIDDCTGQGPDLGPSGLPQVTSYAIYRAADVEAAGDDFVPDPMDTGLVLTQDDDATTIVYVYAFDEDGNYDFCETYVLVQQHVDCGNTTGTLSGVIVTEDNETVEGVEVSASGSAVMSMTTGTDGAFTFELPLGGDFSITPYLNAEPLNGVSTFDLVLMSKHILGVQLLDSPYKMIAADVNRSSTITTLDLIQLRKLILNIDTQFSNNTSWRFVEEAYSFPQPTNPWFELFPELINENDFSADILNANFVAVKTGDVNGNAQANALAGDDRTLNGQFNLEVENETVKAGNVYTVAVRGAQLETVEGFQGTLNLNGAELVDIEYGAAKAENFGLRYAAEGMITASWNGEATAEDVLFSLVIRATADGELSDVISVNDRYTAAEAYGNGNTMNLGVSFTYGDVDALGFELYQNTPNPFSAETLIGFNLPEDAEVSLTVSDASGRVLSVLNGDYAAGYNTINLTKSQVQGATGVLSYTITAGEFTATKTMVAVK